jgi:hypothetical protein
MVTTSFQCWERDGGMTGYCACGCGKPTSIATKTDRHAGTVKGQPRRFVVGHNRRKSTVRYVVTETGCWEWQGAKAPNGYGHIRIAGHVVAAHRHYFEEANGPVPGGMDLDHLCRNRGCVNPDHLEVVLRAENSQRGAATRLTREDVIAIRRMHGAMTAEALAEWFGVSRGAINGVIHRRTWTNVA